MFPEKQKIDPEIPMAIIKCTRKVNTILIHGNVNRSVRNLFFQTMRTVQFLDNVLEH